MAAVFFSEPEQAAPVVDLAGEPTTPTGQHADADTPPTGCGIDVPPHAGAT
ncbi:hypothetical protein AB0F49_09115 [Micromonospora ureilytica]|uniref:hypothetical protein n=1 Tax=Micromonospora ureilytica TaxID=709868 RepID=UPI0033E64344